MCDESIEITEAERKEFHDWLLADPSHERAFIELEQIRSLTKELSPAARRKLKQSGHDAQSYHDDRALKRRDIRQTRRPRHGCRLRPRHRHAVFRAPRQRQEVRDPPWRTTNGPI